MPNPRLSPRSPSLFRPGLKLWVGIYLSLGFRVQGLGFNISVLDVTRRGKRLKKYTVLDRPFHKQTGNNSNYSGNYNGAWCFIVHSLARV